MLLLPPTEGLQVLLRH